MFAETLFLFDRKDYSFTGDNAHDKQEGVVSPLLFHHTLLSGRVFFDIVLATSLFRTNERRALFKIKRGEVVWEATTDRYSCHSDSCLHETLTRTGPTLNARIYNIFLEYPHIRPDKYTVYHIQIQ